MFHTMQNKNRERNERTPDYISRKMNTLSKQTQASKSNDTTHNNDHSQYFSFSFV